MALMINAQTKLTYEEYALLPEDGRIHEIIDGDHVMTPAPGTHHQTISRRIQFQLYTQIETQALGLVFNAPTDVELSPTDIVQPDILVVLAARRGIVAPSRIIGPPDLVIEIISAATRDRDQRLKFALYQRAGVPEYWMVDPDTQRVTQFVRRHDALQPAGEFHDTIAFGAIPGVVVNLGDVW